MLRLIDPHAKHTPEWRRRVCNEIDDEVVVGASRQHRRVVLARPFHQHRQNASAIRFEALALDPLVRLEQPGQTIGEFDTGSSISPLIDIGTS